MLPLNVLAASVRVTSEVVFAKHSGSDPGPSLTQSVKTVNFRQEVAHALARPTTSVQPHCRPGVECVTLVSSVQVRHGLLIVPNCRSTQHLLLCWPFYGTCDFQFSAKDFVCVLIFRSTQEPVDKIGLPQVLSTLT